MLSYVSDFSSSHSLEYKSPNLTWNVLSDKLFFIHLSILSLTPRFSIFWMIFLCGTVSKARSKSTYTISTGWPSSPTTEPCGTPLYLLWDISLWFWLEMFYLTNNSLSTEAVFLFHQDVLALGWVLCVKPCQKLVQNPHIQHRLEDHHYELVSVPQCSAKGCWKLMVVLVRSGARS